MNWFQKLFMKEEQSSSVAKNRLKMVLTHDRGEISPGLMEMIRDDIIKVIVSHLDVDPNEVIVNLNNSEEESRLVAEIPLQGKSGRRVSSSN